jgi:hypothetical protein
MDPDIFDQRIQIALDEQSFSSVVKITKRTCIQIIIGLWRLMSFIDFVVKHLHWPTKTERHQTSRKDTDVKQTLDNPPFGLAPRVAVFCHP